MKDFFVRVHFRYFHLRKLVSIKLLGSSDDSASLTHFRDGANRFKMVPTILMLTFLEAGSLTPSYAKGKTKKRDFESNI